MWQTEELTPNGCWSTQSHSLQNSVCIHPDCPVCKALDREIEADRKKFKKEQAKKKAEYGKRCKAWVAKIHEIIDMDLAR